MRRTRDGHIRLRTTREGVSARIALDAAIFFNLIAYAKRVWPPPEEVARKRMLQDRHEAATDAGACDQ